MKYHIITYGCQMNKSDSERIAALLEKIGFEFSPIPKKADLVILNMCSVRQSAVDREISKVKNLAKLKIQNPNFRILITGCILNKDKRELQKFSDGIFKIDELSKLPVTLKNLGFKIQKIKLQNIKHYLQIEPSYQSGPVAYIPIMTGCNNFCSYCVVSYVRGREVSRPAEEILCEIKNLAKRGVKEIWLLGQNVNSYKGRYRIKKTKAGKIERKGEKINFSKLLQLANAVKGDFWIRFTSSHPKDLTNEMIKTFAKCQKIAPYFNLPIQSGSNKILKAMNRPYTVEKYKKIVKEARKAFKKYRRGPEGELAVSTDVIVGFPGETKKQFQQTKRTFQDIKFSAAYISRYSPRPQTAAAKLKDSVSSQEKKKREKELLKIVEKTALNFNKKFLNKEVEVLILKKKNGFYFGKTRHYQTIKIKSKDDIWGQFIICKVTKSTAYGLEGILKNKRPIARSLEQGTALVP